MNNFSLSLLLSMNLMFVYGHYGHTAESPDSILQFMQQEVKADLMDNVLPFWSKYLPDTVKGCYYGVVLRDGQPIPNAPRGGVLHARILWTWAYASHLFGTNAFRKEADWAFEAYSKRFIDSTDGTAYTLVSADLTPMDSTRQTATAEYGIYALAEYADVTGNKEALQMAQKLYRWIENSARDHSEAGGYFDEMKQSQPVRTTKTTDTHLHLIEAYTRLYRVWPNAELRQRLHEAVTLMTTKLYDAHLHRVVTVADRNWHPIENADCFGHDMEAVWMIGEAALLLGDEPLKSRCLAIAEELVEHVLKEAMSLEGAIPTRHDYSHERQMPFLQWWPQTESINALLFLWEQTGQDRWLQAACKSWQWIKAHLIDQTYGDWFKSCNMAGEPFLKEPKVTMWNCPYHHCRMAYRVIETPLLTNRK